MPARARRARRHRWRAARGSTGGVRRSAVRTTAADSGPVGSRSRTRGVVTVGVVTGGVVTGSPRSRLRFCLPCFAVRLVGRWADAAGGHCPITGFRLCRSCSAGPSPRCRRAACCGPRSGTRLPAPGRDRQGLNPVYTAPTEAAALERASRAGPTTPSLAVARCHRPHSWRWCTGLQCNTPWRESAGGPSGILPPADRLEGVVIRSGRAEGQLGRSTGRRTRLMPWAICLLPALMLTTLTRGSRLFLSASLMLITSCRT